MEGNILPKICVWKTFHISRDNFLTFSLQYVVFYFVVGLVVISILACSGMVSLMSALGNIHLWVFSELFYPKNCFSCCQILNWLANTGKHVEMGGVFFMRPTLCPGKKYFRGHFLLQTFETLPQKVKHCTLFKSTWYKCFQVIA